MYQVIIVVHVLLGLGVIGFVLIQQGKGADAGAAFGSASSGSVFGAQGASSFLSRTTAILAALFFSTSLGLAVLSGNITGDVDLMDAPEAKKVIADVPLVDGSKSSDISKSIPVIKEDVPGAMIDEASTVVDATKKDIQKVVETTGENKEVVIDDTKTVVSDGLETKDVSE